MEHVNPEHLAGLTLGEPGALTDDERRHLEQCPNCRAELAELERVAGLAADSDTRQVPLPPDPAVWRRLQAAVAEPAAEPVHEPRRAAPTEASARPPRVRRRTAVLVGVVALLVGAAVTWAITGRPTSPSVNPPPAEVIARTSLTALPGESGQGQAALLRTSSAVELRVDVNASPAASAYHELWLINADGERMYALGVLPPSGTGTYPLPPALADGLDGYTTVDVSIEPYDGNAAHSRHSLVRGTLS